MSWFCPITQSICGKPHFINRDGSLKHIESHTDINYIRERGAHYVDFPKQSYYPDYDETSPFYKNKNIKDFEELPLEIL